MNTTQIPAVTGDVGQTSTPVGKDSWRAREFWTENNGPVVEYNPDWANGTGYLDGAVDDTSIWTNVPGNRCRAIDPNGRRILIARSPWGNVVVFERTKQTLSADQVVWASNTPRGMHRTGLISGGAVSEQSMEIWFAASHATHSGWENLANSLLNGEL